MTSKIYVEKQEDSNLLFLSGSIEKILNSKRALRFIKDWVDFEVINDRIAITYSDNLFKCLDRIKHVSDLAQCELEFSTHVGDSINEYIEEERKFNEFTLQARNIRDNHCDISSFTNFKNVLVEEMKYRTLYDLQMLSSYHLAFSQNACNFSVPGAGKTSIVYGAYAYLRSQVSDDDRKIEKLLIVGPLSSFSPWELEYVECFGHQPSSKRISGQMPIEDRRQYFYDSNPADITLISYASVTSLKMQIKDFLVRNKVMVVLDEAHKIKNTSGGVIAQSILEIAQFCAARVVLTGTPAPNGYEDLYNIIKFIYPRKDIIKFQIGQLKDMSRNTNDPRVDILVESIVPYFTRIKKSDLKIPRAESVVIHVEMKQAQRRIYEFIERKYISEMAAGKDLSFHSSITRARIIRLMQAASNPNLLRLPLEYFAESEGFSFDESDEDAQMINEILKYSDNEVPAKFDRALEIIREATSTGGKLVVWAINIKTIEYFHGFLDENGVKARILYGKTPIAGDGIDEDDLEFENTREAIIKEFHSEDSKFNVIIANPFAVAESISLHKVCHNAIYIERNFNAAQFIQSKDRIHRFGIEPNTITKYFYLVSKDTIDETIESRLELKEVRLNEIIESMPIPLFDNALLIGGDDDIKAVLHDYARRT